MAQRPVNKCLEIYDFLIVFLKKYKHVYMQLTLNDEIINIKLRTHFYGFMFQETYRNSFTDITLHLLIL